MITKFQKLGGTQCNPTYANAKMPNYKILKYFLCITKFQKLGAHCVIPQMQMQTVRLYKVLKIFLWNT